MSSTTSSTTASAVRTGPSFPRDGRLIGRVGDRLAGIAALVAAPLALVTGVLQVVFPQDTEAAIDPRTRLILAMFTVILWALAVFFVGLARYALSSWGATVAASGAVLLTFGTITSAVNGIDLDSFPVVAVAANVLWLTGSIGLTVSLVRARQASLWLALPLPLLQLLLVFLSQNGGAAPAGIFLAVAGVALSTGAIRTWAARRAARP